MKELEQALVAVAQALDRKGVPYIVIGGLANAVWGVPRATVDVDVTVWVAEEEVPALVTHLSDRFVARVESPLEFARDTRVLPLQNRDGTPIDIIFGLLPYEKDAVNRAVVKEVAGAEVRFCSAEDLILHKIISGREKDLADARQVTRRNLSSLDLSYLEPLLEELVAGLERPEILSMWKEWTRPSP